MFLNGNKKNKFVINGIIVKPIIKKYRKYSNSTYRKQIQCNMFLSILYNSKTIISITKSITIGTAIKSSPLLVYSLHKYIINWHK